MKRVLVQTALLGLAWVASGFAQQAPAPEYAKPVPMPSDRVADSYAIYSQLLPGNQIEWGNVPREFWLMEEVTKAEQLGADCVRGGMMNPHQAIKPPEPRQAEFSEALADFDAHCHDRYLLEASQFHTQLPVHVLDEDAKKRYYMAHVMNYMPPKNDIMRAPPTPDEFKGAAGMHSFTAVYFNHAHTLAMTEIGMYCGGLCGNWKWVVLEKKDGVWKVLPWVSTFTIS